MVHDIQETYRVEAPEQALVLLNPLRGEIAARLVEPASAAEVARMLGETPQRINYHLKALEKVGLVRRTGTRQVRNLVEVLYQAVAKTFVLAEALSMKPETLQKLKDQGALAHLIRTAERVKQDALLLMERSDAAEQVPSAALELQVPLGDETQRAAFIEEYVAAVQAIVRKYAAAGSTGDKEKILYQAVLTVYPKPDAGE
ncbi:ArsR family transcriptional regulator [Gordoniibacillus kamchatkensis]|uniref:ArsR family transcriptional regulator n=1 Tax=Gordoniibacillus kamchatkensis TaxID=1590651 RepID=A0ABR5AE56_9BACL|nr:helix-turn-helix domain-containing protein [Paenibacillus sp. VKM B-2647]KIL38875.1 ArsR family transcriptional regulator [Paenibacillus sp. VKM B-2647]